MTTETYLLIALTTLNVMIWVQGLITRKDRELKMKYLYDHCFERCKLELLRTEDYLARRMEHQIDRQFRQWQEIVKK